jgi:hypothetical protein
MRVSRASARQYSASVVFVPDMAQSCSSADVTGNTELANLRRARSRCHFRLKQAEELAQSYRDKLADLEVRIRACGSGGHSHGRS